VLPALLTQQNDYFNIKHSTFTMEQYKAGSCRQVMFAEMKINNSFTLENSYFQINSRNDDAAPQTPVPENDQPPSPAKAADQ
jgi:hypothetical protein